MYAGVINEVQSLSLSLEHSISLTLSCEILTIDFMWISFKHQENIKELLDWHEDIRSIMEDIVVVTTSIVSTTQRMKDEDDTGGTFNFGCHQSMRKSKTRRIFVQRKVRI
jgi:hypothetical protein